MVRFAGVRLVKSAVALLVAAALGCASLRPTAGSGECDLRVRTLDGRYTTLSSLRGDPVVLTFFATWCFPCMVDVELLKRLHAQNAQHGLHVVGVAMDIEGRKVLDPFVRSYEIPYQIWLADDELREGQTCLGTLRELPLTVVLDREGRVVSLSNGASDPKALERVVQRVVGN